MARSEGTRQQRDTQNQQNETNQGTQARTASGAQQQSGRQQQMSGQQQRGGQQQTALSQRSQAMPAVFVSPFISPFSFMRRFTQDIEQLFNEVGGGGGTTQASQMSDWSPQIEVFQRENQLVIRADLPGINKDNVQVELRDDAVVLRGERQEEHREEREGFYRTERSYGTFYREIPLPEGVDAENATANFRDGVLEITMPLEQGETRGRRLEIRDSSSAEQGRQGAQTAGAGRQA